MMSDFKDWLITKLPSLVPCQDTIFSSGTYDFSINFGTSAGLTNPLNISFLSKKNNTESAGEKLCFSISGKVPELQFVKRLRKTPFFISSLSTDEYSIYIVDFYEWDPKTSIYRIIYFHSVSNDETLEVNLPEDYKFLGKNVYRTEECYFTFSGDTVKEVIDSLVKFPVSSGEKREQIYVFSFSEKNLTSENLSVSSLLAKLNHLISESEDNHILNDIRIQDKKGQHIIDELWSRQKGLNPDRSLNVSLSDDKIIDDNIFLWATEIARYMKWDNLPDANVTKKIQNRKREARKSNKFVYDSYFEIGSAADDVIEYLQSWWDQYSLPLYQVKFKRDLEANPSLIFIIYSLALKMQLPWHADLYRLCNLFYNEPQIALLAFVYQLVILQYGENDTVQISPGSASVGNVKILKSGDTEYQYTRFGDVRFTSVKRHTVEIVKIDKEVIINHDKTYQNISIKPNIPPFRLNRLRTNQILIQVDNKFYQVPLVWKKTDLSIPGCRIRWIFKKDRFQFTCQPNKFCKSLKIDNNEINITDTKKIKYYHPVDKSGDTAAIRLYDISGRSFFLDQDLPAYQAQIVGWIQDRYGLFVNGFNIRLNAHQIPCKVEPSGKIRQSFAISSKLESIGIGTRKALHPVQIGKINYRPYGNLMRYSHRAGKSILLIIVDDKLNIRKSEIQQRFMEYLGFPPLVMYKSETKINFKTPYMICIDKSEDRHKSKTSSSNSNLSFLSLSFPEGIQNLFKILSDFQKN